MFLGLIPTFVEVTGEKPVGEEKLSSPHSEQGYREHQTKYHYESAQKTKSYSLGTC